MQMLNVEQVTKSKSGKALRVKANGEWYGARLESGLDAAVGKAIEAETSNDEKYGLQIGKYRIVAAPGNGSTNAAQLPPTSSSPAPSGGAGAAPIWSNFVSNQVAHAIAAGKIETPEQIKVWAEGAKKAFVDLLA